MDSGVDTPGGLLDHSRRIGFRAVTATAAEPTAIRPITTIRIEAGPPKHRRPPP
jgi:hypothetical protein